MDFVIYKSVSPNHTDRDIKNLSCPTVNFVSFERLLDKSINEAVGIKPNEKAIGMKITNQGLEVYIETK